MNVFIKISLLGIYLLFWEEKRKKNNLSASIFILKFILSKYFGYKYTKTPTPLLLEEGDFLLSNGFINKVDKEEAGK